ncbi:molecular chaperone MKKS [Eucyclogobius newberryi]|uniref:molecular chaperone MKKS n=1 Tax=Eucyclogobius newberryi TaxID=166745 RepID=UPI003B5B43FA
MSRLEKKKPARCTDLPLNNADICSKLNILRQLLKSCYGPTGRLKQIHNNVGGQVVTTSTSSVLLSALTSSEPFINLIRTSIINHISRFNDCGLFAGILCMSLIEKAQLSCLRKDVCQKVNKSLLDLCTSYLQQEDCACKVKMDFNSSHCLIRLAQSVISSKPACVLREAEIIHVSRLTVQGFLLTVPCDNSGVVRLGRIITVPVEGLPVMDSDIFPGLLLETPDLPIHQTGPLHAVPLRTIIFSASLAGDLTELGEGTIEVHRGADVEAQILKQLLRIGDQVVKDEVNLFMCQKVIHPVLQQYLRDHHITVIERLGINLLEPVIHLTGAQPVATLHTIPPNAYGKIKEITIKQFGAKTMLHLHPTEEAAICTLIPCHRNETMLNELKVACEKAEHVLRLTLRDPFALFGGGCFETHLAAYIRHKSKTTGLDAASMFGCTQTEYLLAVEGFCRSLESVTAALEHDGGSSIIDLTHAHHWTLPTDTASDEMDPNLSRCRCGAVKHCKELKWSFLNTKYTEFSASAVSGEADVLDSFTAKVNGLQVAVETANLALDVQYIIQDTN